MQAIPFTLRPYQQEAVDATLKHFRRHDAPAAIVLPTGAGKSLVIAELARVARGRVLVLAHVKELVAQNHSKYLLRTGCRYFCRRTEHQTKSGESGIRQRAVGCAQSE